MLAAGSLWLQLGAIPLNFVESQVQHLLAVWHLTICRWLPVPHMVLCTRSPTACSGRSVPDPRGLGVAERGRLRGLSACRGTGIRPRQPTAALSCTRHGGSAAWHDADRPQLAAHSASGSCQLSQGCNAGSAG